jgi:hypothetical protein
MGRRVGSFVLVNFLRIESNERALNVNANRIDPPART